MKFNLLSLTTLMLLLLAIPSTSMSQPSFEEQRMLSLLRGSWEYPTYEELHTLVFQSDTKLELDRIPLSYSIQENNLFITSENGIESYSFEMQSNRLLVTYPDGTQRKFTRKEFGEVEKQLVGAFYPSDDTSWFASCLQFYDDMKYTLTEQAENSTSNFSKRNGLFRVENKSVILAFDDGEIEQAFVRFYSSDGLVDGLLFREKLFDRELLFTQKPIDTIDYPPQPSPGPPPRPGPEPHPPCLTCAPPPPCPEPLPIAVPIYYPANPSPPVENKLRDFGSRRDASSNDNTNSGHQEQQKSRRGKP